jgi:hypothetical protein
VKLSAQCDLPISLPQVLGLMQAVQPFDPPARLGPGVGASVATSASRWGPRTPAAATGTGPLPGPVLRALP